MSMELLSPAGDRESLLAAVKSGADAVYLGATALNARAGAGNFDREALCRATDYAHERGVRVHVTVNTVVKEGEMALLDDVADQLAEAGVDAAIVQDLGVASRLRRLLPSLSLHASTQMALHNAQGAQFARDAGFSRAVLAREATFEEMAECAATGIETEVFAHGALCVSCSGQCLFSSLVGGRSGNRGMCAQPCRLPYRLSGAVRAEGYLLSPKDLMTLDELAALRDAGVTSLKIEGRLKRPEYVAAVTAAYREALDLLETYGEYQPAEETREELMQVFNRGGFTRGYGPGLVDRELMSRERPNHQGVPAGKLESGGRLRLTRDLRPGDALVLRAPDGADLPLRGLSGRAGEALRVNLPRSARPGMPLYRLTSEEQSASIHESLSAEPQTVLLSGYFRARAGERALLQLTDGQQTARVESPEPLERAERPADETRARAQLSKTGGTPYRLIDLSLQIAPDAFLPASLLNELRRQALARLSQARIRAARGCAHKLTEAPPAAPADLPAPPDVPLLRVESADWAMLCRLEEADERIFRPEDLSARGLAKTNPDRPFALALPMVCSAESLDRLCDWAQEHAERLTAVYIANPGHLVVPWPCERRADFSLNLANREALAFWFSRGLQAYTPSVELTAQEIRQLDPSGGARELLVYGRVPLMQLRHCPIRAQLGGPHAACRRCDQVPAGERLNDHQLIDRKNVRFPLRRVKSDEGCIVRVLNSAPLFLLRHMDRLPPSAAWRLYLTDETPEEAQSLVRLHRLALGGKDFRSSAEWALWESRSTTTGHYFRKTADGE